LSIGTTSSSILFMCKRHCESKMANESFLLKLGYVTTNVVFSTCFRKWLFGIRPRRQIVRNCPCSLLAQRILKIVASRTCTHLCPLNVNGYLSGYTQKWCQFY
jgi:hypothetical protein